MIIIATVSGIITFMLLFAIVATMACVIYKRKRKGEQLKGLQKAPSEGTVLFLFIFCLLYYLLLLLFIKLTLVSGCPFS